MQSAFQLGVLRWLLHVKAKAPLPAADHFLRERGLTTACYHGDVPVS